MGNSTVREVEEAVGFGFEDISAAHARISNVAHCTPVLQSSQMNHLLSNNETTFHFKAEAFQKTGSFKFRGAYNAVSAHLEQHTDDTAPPPVVTHSSGNHGQALACAALLKGVDAHIVVPSGSAEVKIAAIRGYKAHVSFCRASLADREEAAAQVCSRVGGRFIHPFEDPLVMAGQGTIALEFLKQVGDLDAVVAPVGGGGMLGGIAVAIKTLRPEVYVFGAEPKLADDAARSKAAGAHLPMAQPSKTIADGVRAGLGRPGFVILDKLVEDVLTVSEEEITRATKLVWERMKVAIEPSAGVGVAATQTDKFRARKFKNVAVVLCGGNVDLQRLPWL